MRGTDFFPGHAPQGRLNNAGNKTVFPSSLEDAHCICAFDNAEWPQPASTRGKGSHIRAPKILSYDNNNGPKPLC